MANQQLLFDSASPQTAMLAGTFYIILILAGTVAAVSLIRRNLGSPLDWPGRIQWLQARPWTWREGLGVFAIIGMLVLLSTAMATLFTRSREPIAILLQSLLMDLTGLAAIAGVIFMRRWTWPSAFGLTVPPLSSLKLGILFYVILMPFMLVSSLVYQGILYAHGYPPSMQDIALFIAGNKSLWMRVSLIFLAMIVAPLFEECLFRGILLPLLVRRLGLGTGIFLTSFVFASIHAHLPSLIPLTVVAAGFSLAYLYTRSLWVPIVMHGLFNGVNLALLLVIK